MATEKKRRFRLLLLPFALAGAVLAVLGALNPTNFAATQADHPDARLRPRRYRCSVDEVREAVEAIIPNLATFGRRWRVVATQPGEVRAEVPVLVFTDDLTVTLRAAPDSVLVEARSSARLGRSDLGENRRHLVQLLTALDTKLSSFEPFWAFS